MSKDPRYPEPKVSAAYARAAKRATEKDDCFDMPEPGTPYYARIEAEAEEYAARREQRRPSGK